MKPGYKTTEFWIPIIVLVGAILLAAIGKDAFAQVLLGGGIVQGAAYQKGRMDLKKAEAAA